MMFDTLLKAQYSFTPLTSTTMYRKREHNIFSALIILARESSSSVGRKSILFKRIKLQLQFVSEKKGSA